MMRSVFAGILGLLLGAGPALAQKPADAEIRDIIERARQKALHYAQSLPDFVCTETIRRSQEQTERQISMAIDKLTVKLSFFNQLEQHTLPEVDDKPATIAYDSAGGVIGAGEFGSMLRDIFEPASQAQFRWEGWKVVRGKRLAEYSYAVHAAHSQYTIFSSLGGDRKGIVGYGGRIQLDPDTGEVFHFNYDADHIPNSLAVECGNRRRL